MLRTAPIRVSCARGFIGQALGHVWGMFVPHVWGTQGVTMYILLYVWGSARVCACVWAYVSGSSVFAAFAQRLCRMDLGRAMGEWVCVHGWVLDLGSTGVCVCMDVG